MNFREEVKSIVAESTEIHSYYKKVISILEGKRKSQAEKEREYDEYIRSGVMDESIPNSEEFGTGTGTNEPQTRTNLKDLIRRFSGQSKSKRGRKSKK